jgi:hypothetical protein
MSGEKTDKKYRLLLILLLAGALFANIKSMFVDFDIDVEYALSMSYRMLRGDVMFAQMSEIHQTSAFLATFFMGIYKAVAGTTTGIVIYMQFVGILLHGGVCLAVYKTLNKRIDTFLAALIAIFLFTVSPKDLVFPEYSNMQIWFSMLLFICLVIFMETKSMLWLAAGSLCLCLEIISYPGCIVVYPFVIVLMFFMTENKLKNILSFSFMCLFQGIVYIAYFWIKLGAGFWTGVVYTFLNDNSHGVGRYQGIAFWQWFSKGVVWLAMCVAAAFIISMITKRRSFFWLSMSVCLIASEVTGIVGFHGKNEYVVIYILFLAAELAGVKYCNKTEKNIVLTGMAVSIGSLTAVFIASNQYLVYSLKYLMLGVAVSFIPVSKLVDRDDISENKILRNIVFAIFCAAVICRRGLAIKTMQGTGTWIADLGGIVKSGPTLGIVTDYMGAYMSNVNFAEWKNQINSGDKVFIADGSTIAYLYEDVDVCAPSTICTPTYDDSIVEYWERNPDKYPDVVAVSCWYGELKTDENGWIMQWLDKDFKADEISDESYWRFYRRD